MALKGLDIFKLSPKKNCKECGSPTCMAFCMKVAQGAVELSKCPYFSEDAIAKLSEATAPPMKTLTVGDGIQLGGETVLFRHEKTLVSRNRFAGCVCSCMDEATVDAKLADLQKVDYERIGEREYVEFVRVALCDTQATPYVDLVKKAMATGRTLILDCPCPETAKAALELCKDGKHDQVKLVALSGPTHAEEVALDMPTSIVSACRDMDVAEQVQDVFMNSCMRTYTNADVLGVELCGAMKNIVALANNSHLPRAMGSTAFGAPSALVDGLSIAGK